MPPTLLDLVGDIRQAVERLPHDQLVDILVYVFKEYVVEGPAPVGAFAAPAPDALAGMSFAEVVRSLQLRLELPELELFEVQGERVSVRLQGRLVPLSAAPAHPAAAPLPAAVPAAVQQAGPTAMQQSPPAAGPAGAAGAGGTVLPARPTGAPTLPASTVAGAGAAAGATAPAAAVAPAGPGAAGGPPAAGSPAAATQQPAAAPGPRGGLLEID